MSYNWTLVKYKLYGRLLSTNHLTEYCVYTVIMLAYGSPWKLKVCCKNCSKLFWNNGI